MASATVFDSTLTHPGGTGSTITVTLPTHAVGDEIRIAIGNTGNVLWTGNPTGWERITQQQVGTASNGLVGTWFRRRVVSGDSLPLANPTFTLGATVSRIAIARSVRGADLEGINILSEWSARAFNTGTANPIRPSAVTTIAPEMLVLVDYFQRAATNAPDQSGYTQDEEIIISGTLVGNASQKTVADQQTILSNQDASPTSGARWVAGIVCVPSPDYAYYRSGSSANVTGTSATPALPNGTSSSDNRGNKDLIIATSECAGATPAPNTPADWTEITNWATTTSGGATTIRKWYAFYDGTLDRQFNRPTSGEIFVYFSTYRNAKQSNPIGSVAVQQNASSTSSTFPAMARTATKGTVQITCVADGTPTYTSPSTWIERNDSQGVTCADQPFNPTGTVSSASFTLSTTSPTAAGLLEIKSVASVVEWTRSVVIDGAAAIDASANFFSVFSVASAIDAAATVLSDGERVVSRSAVIDAVGAIETAGEVTAPVQTFERSASLSCVSAIESVATFFSVFERVALFDISGLIESSALFLTEFNRAVVLDVAGAIETVAVSFSVLQGTATIGCLTALESSGLFFSDFNRSVTMDVTVEIDTTSQFFSILTASAEISNVGSIEGAGEVESGAGVHERAASCDGLGVISITGQKGVLRSVSLSVNGLISAAGNVPSVGFHLTRLAGVNKESRIQSISAESRRV